MEENGTYGRLLEKIRRALADARPDPGRRRRLRRAAASGATEVVDDVAADLRYLSCFVSTQQVAALLAGGAP